MVRDLVVDNKRAGCPVEESASVVFVLWEFLNLSAWFYRT